VLRGGDRSDGSEKEDEMKETAQTEREMRETENPWPKSKKELHEYIDSLVDREHDYGTCCYAMSLAALAAFNYVAHTLGCTGFQASCADLNFIGRTRHMKHGFRIIDYENLLYPQYLTDERFPTHQQLLSQNREELAKAARELLATRDLACDEVRERWEYVASLGKP
jgi:hypothetical protein